MWNFGELFVLQLNLPDFTGLAQRTTWCRRGVGGVFLFHRKMSKARHTMNPFRRDGLLRFDGTADFTCHQRLALTPEARTLAATSLWSMCHSCPPEALLRSTPGLADAWMPSG